MEKVAKRNLSGVLLLDKAIGISSNKALQQVKHLYSAQKAGHTGSLDPLASGMLPICFGEATKFSQYLLDANKEYYAVGQLGIKTNSGDAEGMVIEERSVPVITNSLLHSAINAFIGTITQIPPMYSALKFQGQPLYQLARKGIEIERQPRQVQIFKIELCSFQHNQLALKVACSKGTYIRTLIEDIGEQLDCGAHVTLLRRLSVAHYSEKQMLSFDKLKEIFTQDGYSAIDNLLQPVDSLLPDFDVLHLSTIEATKIRQGQSIPYQLPSQAVIKLYTEDCFIGLGKEQEGKLLPERLIAY